MFSYTGFKSLSEQKEKHDCVKVVQDFNWTMAKLQIYIEGVLEEDECSKLKNLIYHTIINFELRLFTTECVHLSE